MYRKHNHREGGTRAARLSLQSLFVRVWNFVPGVSISLNSPPAEIRAVNDELLGNSGNGVGLKSYPTPFVEHSYMNVGTVDEWRLAA